MTCTCYYGDALKADYLVWSACGEATRATRAGSSSDDFAQHIAAAARRLDAEQAQPYAIVAREAGYIEVAPRMETVFASGLMFSKGDLIHIRYEKIGSPSPAPVYPPGTPAPEACSPADHDQMRKRINDLEDQVALLKPYAGTHNSLVSRVASLEQWREWIRS